MFEQFLGLPSSVSTGQGTTINPSSTVGPNESGKVSNTFTSGNFSVGGLASLGSNTTYIILGITAIALMFIFFKFGKRK